jgi:hypothetical protein
MNGIMNGAMTWPFFVILQLRGLDVVVMEVANATKIC